MRCIGLAFMLILALLAAPPAAEAQQAAKVYRIGLLETGVLRPRPWEAFRERLGELGYVEGRTLAFETRWADGQVDRLPGLTAAAPGPSDVRVFANPKPKTRSNPISGLLTWA